MDLKELREQIDAVDRQIVDLFQKRMRICADIADYKKKTGKAVYDAQREREKMNELAGMAEPEFRKDICALYSSVMDLSRSYQARRIGAEGSVGTGQRQYGLLGEKLGHSFSPQIHAQLGDYSYGLYEVKPEDLDVFLRETPLLGMNVTIPYKKTVIPYCESLSEEAESIGSVNTIVLEEDGWHGYNTDYDGFRYMVSEYAGFDVRGRKGVIFGNGGAACSVRAALRDMGADPVITISRRGPVFYEDTDAYADADFIVNATPVGMFPETGKSVCSLDVFDRVQAVFDLIYNPRRTELLRQAQERGLTALNGLSMLVAQAVRASEIFTGREIGSEVTKRILKRMEEQESL